LLPHGRVRRAWLGIAAQTVPMSRRAVLHHGLAAASAVSVDEVIAASPAERAGVRPGDRIVRVDEHSTPDVDALHRLLGGDHAGREVRLERSPRAGAGPRASDAMPRPPLRWSDETMPRCATPASLRVRSARSRPTPPATWSPGRLRAGSRRRAKR
jgi:hypothetical protein